MGGASGKRTNRKRNLEVSKEQEKKRKPGGQPHSHRVKSKER